MIGSRLLVSRLVVGIVSTSVFASSGLGQELTLGASHEVQPANREAVEELTLNALFTRSEAGVIRYAKGQRARAVSSRKSRAYSGGPAQAALEYLREHELNRFADPEITPRAHQVLELGGHTLVRVRSELRGIPIRDASASFLVTPKNEIASFFGHTHSPDLVVNRDWRVSENDARDLIKKRFQSVQESLSMEPYYRVAGRSAEPYWEGTVVDTTGEWSVQISAVRGEIERIDSLRWGQAQGYVFNANPIKSQIAQVQLGNLTSNTNLTGASAKVYSYLPNLLFLLPPRSFLQVAEPVGGNYLFPPSDLRFSEVQLYYGIDRAASRFREIGFPGFGRPLEGMVLYKNLVQSQGQPFFVGSNNAFFSPVEFSGRGGLFFYLTARDFDTAWDSDVIFHEYTHAVVSQLVGRSQGPTFRAINEGTADYFAASFLDDPSMGEWAARIFGSRSFALRNVENSNLWPSNLVGEEHVDGNIWSGALWDLRRAIGADRANRTALASLAIMDGGAEFFDAAVAVAAAARALYGDAASNTAINVLVNRGVGTVDAQVASRSNNLRSGLASAPASIPAASASSQLLAAQQFRIDIPNQAEGLRIQVNATGNVRFFVRYRAPITIENGQLVFEQFSPTPGTSIAGTLTLNSTPELQRGTYYVGVTNTTTTAITYTVTATVIGGSANAGPATTVLASGQRATGSAPAGPFLSSRQFAIDVPSSATGLTISLSGNKDVDLHLTAGSPVRLNEQGFPESDFDSATDASNESLTITSRSVRQNLRPGRYYIGVVNYSSDTATFSVTATLSATPLPALQTQVLAPETSITINAPSFAPSPGVGALVPQQVSIAVPVDASSLRISAATQLDVDVIVKKGSAFSAGSAPDHVYVPTSAQADLEITANSSPPLQPGATYFIAIGNYTANGGPVTLRTSIGRLQAGGQISAAGIVSAASFQGGGVAPGEIVTIFGSGIGPPTLTGLQLVGGRVGTQVAQTRVLFDGVAAPIIYVSSGQISCVAPYSLASKSSVTVVVEYQGQNSNAVIVPVNPTRPAIFTANASGSGQGAILNQDNSVNSTSNPADRGSIVVLYATGEGATTPAGVDGQIANTVFPKPLGDVSVTIGGVQAEILYAGSAPGLVAGVFQVNVRIPNSIAAGVGVPVQVRVGGATSRTGVTLSVR